MDVGMTRSANEQTYATNENGDGLEVPLANHNL
jgi:hypothetical protein